MAKCIQIITRGKLTTGSKHTINESVDVWAMSIDDPLHMAVFRGRSVARTILFGVSEAEFRSKLPEHAEALDSMHAANGGNYDHVVLPGI